MRLFSTLIGILGLGALAIGQSEILPIQRNVVPSTPINTRSLVPQIDNSLSKRNYAPRNPKSLPLPIGEPNNLPVGGATFLDPRISTKARFAGITMNGGFPADPDIAVGRNHVVQAVNSRIAFYTKAGAQQLLQNSTTFFSGLGAGSFQFDPKLFYDKFTDRFVMVFLEQDDASLTSKLLIAVSDDGDPNGTWFRYRIEAKLNISGTNYWLDYPGFGCNQTAYVCTGNMFSFGANSFNTTQTIVIPKAPVLNNLPVTTSSLTSNQAFTLQVAECTEPTPLGNIFMVGGVNNSNFRVFSVNNPLGTPTLSVTVLPVASFTPPGDAASTGGFSLDTIGSRHFNASYRDGNKIVFAHAVSSAGRAASRWYEINTNSWPTSGSCSVTQTGTVADPSFDLFFPTITQNAAGSIGMVMARSSSTSAPAVVVSGRLATDTAGTMSAPTVLATSAGTGYSLNRWGDYLGIEVDPTNDYLFWCTGKFVQSNNQWGTDISSFNITGAPVVDLSTCSISPTTVQGGNTATGTVTLSANAPAGGAIVRLRSSDNRASVPASVTITAGTNSTTFTVTTSSVPRNRTVEITASRNGLRAVGRFLLTR
jgi:hypothetical protein